ncbi:MAG: DUF6438 domain-containing protein [Gemmatimonadaceae bacterium]
MMRRPHILILAGLLSIAACKKKSEQLTLTTVPASLVASLERGPCRGSCPDYRVEVYGDGRVRFFGKQHVGSIGVHNGTTTLKEVRQLIKQVAASEVASADTAYVMGSKGCGQYYTDLPMSTLTVRVGEQLKTIQHDPGCRNAPAFLKTLEAQVDSAARSAMWIAGNGEKAK